MRDACTWHHKTFLGQLYWHLAIKLHCTAVVLFTMDDLRTPYPPTTMAHLLPLFTLLLILYSEKPSHGHDVLLQLWLSLNIIGETGTKPTHPNLETVSIFIGAVVSNRAGKDRGVKPSIVNSTRQTQEDTGTPLTCTLGGETMEEVTRSDPNRQLPLPLSIQCHPEIPSWSQQGYRARYCYHWEVNGFLFCFYLCVVLFGVGFVVVVGSGFFFFFFFFSPFVFTVGFLFKTILLRYTIDSLSDSLAKNE